MNNLQTTLITHNLCLKYSCRYATNTAPCVLPLPKLDYVHALHLLKLEYVQAPTLEKSPRTLQERMKMMNNKTSLIFS